MIVLTGATGALNGATARHLLTAVPASELAVVARDPGAEAARRFAAAGVEVRHGDYADPSSLAAAFSGADQLLLVSSSDPNADAVALHRAAIDAAAAAGAGRLLYTSHQGAAADTPFGPGRDHFATEKLLADSGLAWTSLRNGFYAHSLAWLAGPWRETGVIAVPADGPVSWTDRDDAAEAAARIILAIRDGGTGFDGPVTLTAAEAPTFADLAAVAARVGGLEVRTEVLPRDEWLSNAVAAGQQDFMARFLLGFYDAAAGGFFAGTAPTLADLLGRAPRSAADALAAAPAAH